MPLVNQFKITLKDFWPDHADGMFITDPGRGTTTTISRRLYNQLRAYADDHRLPFHIIVQRLRDEIHRPPAVYTLTCTKCGHTGEMCRRGATTTDVTGFASVRVYPNGTVVAICRRAGATNPSVPCLSAIRAV